MSLSLVSNGENEQNLRLADSRNGLALPRSRLQDTRELLNVDLEVYYTAASMVAHRESADIYNGADSGIDPQLRWADPASLFATKARNVGIDRVQLYVYPPTLADLMVPITAFSIEKAEILWKIVNIAALIGSGLLLANLLQMPIMGARTVAVCAFLVLFRPDLECMDIGQITAVLLLLLVGGFFLYVRNQRTLGMLLFALAAAIKITPLIVLVPLIAWRDWKAVRDLMLWVAGILVAIWFVNGGSLLVHYVKAVLPPMSAGAVILTNKSLGSAVQLLWRAASGHVSSGIGIAIKLISIGIICFVGWQTRVRNPRELPAHSKLVQMSLFWMLACCLAPVSWRHAYVLAAPALVILAVEAIKKSTPLINGLLLIAFTLSISSFGLDSFAKSRGTVLFVLLAMLAPLLGVAVALLESHRIARRAELNPAAQSIYVP